MFSVPSFCFIPRFEVSELPSRASHLHRSNPLGHQIIPHTCPCVLPHTYMSFLISNAIASARVLNHRNIFLWVLSSHSDARCGPLITHQPSWAEEPFSSQLSKSPPLCLGWQNIKACLLILRESAVLCFWGTDGRDFSIEFSLTRPATGKHCPFDSTHPLVGHFPSPCSYTPSPVASPREHIICLHFLPRTSPQTSDVVVVQVVEWLEKNKNNSQSSSWDFLCLYFLSLLPLSSLQSDNIRFKWFTNLWNIMREDWISPKRDDVS